MGYEQVGFEQRKGGVWMDQIKFIKMTKYKIEFKIFNERDEIFTYYEFDRDAIGLINFIRGHGRISVDR